jgi:hypothetical protein
MFVCGGEAEGVYSEISFENNASDRQNLPGLGMDVWLARTRASKASILDSNWINPEELLSPVNCKQISIITVYCVTLTQHEHNQTTI